MSTTNTATTPATSTNNITTTRSNDTYVYGIGMLAVVPIGVCVFFTYQAKNNKQDYDRLAAQHEQKKQDQPPKQCHML